MKRALFLFGLILALGCGLHAQAAAPVDTTVCDIVKKPASFDGKMVRLKGTVIAGFDEFAVEDAADPNCGFQVDVIWLSFPPGSKAKAGPVAMLTLQPAHNFAGTYTAPSRAPVTLEKDKNFKQFDSLLSQTHQKGADMCLGCTRYMVTATLVGRLDAVADATLKRDGGKIVGFGGFGNMNAYPTRLVLASVADITPKEIDFSKNDLATKGDSSLGAGNGSYLNSMASPGGIDASRTQANTGGASDMLTVIGSAQKSAAAMAASPAKDEAERAMAAYGKPGEHTGVQAKAGITNEASPADEALGAKDSPDGVLFNFTFSSDRLPGDELTRAVIHMGEHIADLRSPKPGNEDAPVYVLEYDAWTVTAVSAIVSGQPYLTLPGAYLTWSAGWPAADRPDKMDAALKDFLSNEAQLSR